MHIGFIAMGYPSASGGSGVATQVRTLARALVDAGHQATVVALSEPGSPTLSEDAGVKVYRFTPTRLHCYVGLLPGIGSLLAPALRELEWSWAAYRQLRALHADRPFDVLEGTETGAFWAALCMSRVPLV